jgi:hypothetical protein
MGLPIFIRVNIRAYNQIWKIGMRKNGEEGRES